MAKFFTKERKMPSTALLNLRFPQKKETAPLREAAQILLQIYLSLVLRSGGCEPGAEGIASQPWLATRH